MLQLLEPGEAPEGEHLPGHADAAEDVVQLTRAMLGRPAAAEFRQVPADLAEGGAIAAVVAAGLSQADGAAGEDLAHDRRDLADAVVLGVVADIEDLVVHLLRRRLERK